MNWSEKILRISEIYENFQIGFILLPHRRLTLSRRRPLSYRNQSIDLLCKSMDWFLYNNYPRHERVN